MLKSILIILGAMLMVVDIIKYVLFLKTTQDVLSSGSRRDKVWKILALILLVFFFTGYLFIVFFSKPDLMMAMILYFGSVFVAIVISLMFNLMNTAKTRSIEIADVLIGVIDARDPNLNGHSRHVRAVTMLFYSYLPGWAKAGINPVSLEYAALMHDVGKLSIPEAIINKPSSLTEEEWQIVKEHPRYGVKIMEPLPTFSNIRDWILYHHERIDGKGYYGVESDKIPIASRILAIADTYSAITMRRSYKDTRTHDEAVRIMCEVAGTQLDERLVEIFLTIPKEELESCMPDTVKY